MEHVSKTLEQSDAGLPTKNLTSTSNTEQPIESAEQHSSNTADRGSLSSSAKQAACPICGDAGYLREDVPAGHPQFGQIVACQCQLAKLEARRLSDLRTVSDLDALARYTFDNFKPDLDLTDLNLSTDERKSLRLAYESACAFAQKPEGWLVLLGDYGCGKTHLAAAIANEQVARGQPALFVAVPDLLDHLRAAYGPNSPTTYDQRFNEVRNAALLILDDLGTQYGTEWAQEKLFQIFNHRYNARLPTVITSNLDLESIDIRIRSRLLDPLLVQVCTILAPDFRNPNARQTASKLSSLDLHEDQTFDSFSLRERELNAEQVNSLRQAFTFARNYAKNPEDWLLLTGGYGCGKTHLAAAIANECVRQGYPALFVVVPDLLDHLRATYAPNSPVSYDRRLDEIRNASLLVLDDLGTHSATPWAQEKLYQIINHRYNARLPTIITATDEDDAIDQRLKSRLLDRARCTSLLVNVPSYRGSEARVWQRPGRRMAFSRR